MKDAILCILQANSIFLLSNLSLFHLTTRPPIHIYLSLTTALPIQVYLWLPLIVVVIFTGILVTLIMVGRRGNENPFADIISGLFNLCSLLLSIILALYYLCFLSSLLYIIFAFYYLCF